jgi:uncharacterized protein (TIGR00251 family)
MNIEVKVIAGARKRGMSLEGTILKVKLLSKPLKGKANEELVEYIADTFHLKRRDVVIVAGERDTRKLVSFPLDIDSVRSTLDEERRVESGKCKV